MNSTTTPPATISEIVDRHAAGRPWRDELHLVGGVGTAQITIELAPDVHAHIIKGTQWHATVAFDGDTVPDGFAQHVLAAQNLALELNTSEAGSDPFIPGGGFVEVYPVRGSHYVLFRRSGDQPGEPYTLASITIEGGMAEVEKYLADHSITTGRWIAHFDHLRAHSEFEDTALPEDKKLMQALEEEPCAEFEWCHGHNQINQGFHSAEAVELATGKNIGVDYYFSIDRSGRENREYVLRLNSDVSTKPLQLAGEMEAAAAKIRGHLVEASTTE